MTASAYTLRSNNVIKTFLLLSIFLIIFIGIGWLVSWYFDNPLFLYIAIAIALITNIRAYWYSDTLAIKLTRAYPITRDQYFDIWNSLENLAIGAGVPMPKLYMIDDPSPNAFATGRDTKHSAVVVTKGLVNTLNKQEMEGVLAHELAHIINRDTLIMTSTVVLVAALSLVLDLALHFSFFGNNHNSKGGPWAFVAIIIIIILTPIIATVIKLAISRKREFVADATAVLLTRYPEGLASALERIEHAAQPMKRSDTATAHLFIANPMHNERAKKIGWRERIFSTHPPISKRVAALRGTL